VLPGPCDILAAAGQIDDGEIKLKNYVRPASAKPVPEQSKAKGKPNDAMSRIKLALLDQYSQASESQGGDPYNANQDGNVDQWRGNSRRI
jgi:hypothetical protein